MGDDDVPRSSIASHPDENDEGVAGKEKENRSWYWRGRDMGDLGAERYYGGAGGYGETRDSPLARCATTVGHTMGTARRHHS